MDSGPFFPLELEREIFETTAELYPVSIRKPCLLLVAKRVREWIERIKYRSFSTVPNASQCSFDLLQAAILSNSKSADFFHKYVQHLLIGTLRIEEVISVLSACSGLCSLMLLTELVVGPSILPSLAAMKLRRLSVYLLKLFGGAQWIDLSHPAFTSLTHLEAFDMSFRLRLEDLSLSTVGLPPTLTHLALNGIRKSEALEVLSTCPKLEILLRMTYSSRYKPEDLLSIDDPRFVSMSLSKDMNSEWLAGTKGSVDYWVRAERFIVKKRRGEIEPKRPQPARSLLRSAVVANSQPAGFFYARVRHLLCDEDVPVDELLQILSACGGIHSLALASGVVSSILPSLAIIKPRRLSISLGSLFGSTNSIDLSHSSLARVTHLESLNNYRPFQDFPASSVGFLPALTHLD
ncbi:hypothetical protein B0H17DRAFT_1202407 [Mycena rosella]|uniref:Uncharacterized protein n=1 Tax=Mycena rosella TaxID=1033263 RepID=A0AAD7GIB0_MYCRO|nr:hypothetical protein B0H17DRAFT_1202407 [Mycena rosella]